MFNKFYLSLLSVNFSHAHIIYAKIFEEMLSGSLEVSFSIDQSSAFKPNGVSHSYQFYHSFPF